MSRSVLCNLFGIALFALGIGLSGCTGNPASDVSNTETTTTIATTTGTATTAITLTETTTTSTTATTQTSATTIETRRPVLYHEFSDQVKSAYLEVIQDWIDEITLMCNGETPNHGPYWLLYIDNDNIPELYVTWREFGRLFTFSDGKTVMLQEHWSARKDFFCGYAERGNWTTEHGSGGAGGYSTTIYNLKNGTYNQIALFEKRWEQVGEAGYYEKPKYEPQYFVDKVAVSKEEWEERLNGYTSSMIIREYSNGSNFNSDFGYTYDEIVALLSQ